MKNKISMPLEMSDAVEMMVDTTGLPLKALAVGVGKAYSTLAREMDKTDTGAKLGVDTLWPLIRECQAALPDEPPMPLLWLADKCGYSLIRKAHAPDKSDLRDELLDDHGAQNDLENAIRNGQPPHVVKALAAKLRDEIGQTEKMYDEWYAKHNKAALHEQSNEGSVSVVH